ncbi:hypothetical protein EL466_13385 [Enterococcus faecium]|nr:hypothetical protein [Enterococcus faecium]
MVKRFKRDLKIDYKRGKQKFPPKKPLLFSLNRFANFSKLLTQNLAPYGRQKGVIATFSHYTCAVA